MPASNEMTVSLQITHNLVWSAKVVRASDTDTHDGAPLAVGPLAISAGLLRKCKVDEAQLDAAMALYGLSYCCARDGADKCHDRPADRKS